MLHTPRKKTSKNKNPTCDLYAQKMYKKSAYKTLFLRLILLNYKFRPNTYDAARARSIYVLAHTVTQE